MSDGVESSPEVKSSQVDEVALQRFSMSLPPMQNDALNAMSRSTGLSKVELIRHAVALLNVAVSARKRGLNLALTNDDNDVVGHIVSTV